MILVNINVKALVYNKEGLFLAIKRNYTNQKWDLPGGAVELPETVNDALEREVKEETGLEVSNVTIVEAQSVYGDDKEYLIFLAFKCQAINPENVVLSHEHSDYKWVSKNKFLDLEASSYLKDLLNRI